MVEPDMATMLAFLLTDADVPRKALQAMLSEAASRTFNCISIDSDQSTSDTLLALSSRRTQCSLPDLEAAIGLVCAQLAEDVVRNGEGVRHVIRIRVVSCNGRARARTLAKAVVNSPLFKAAVCGNDPNVGRLISALGSSAAKLVSAGGAPVDFSRVNVSIGGCTVFRDGEFCLTPTSETAVHKHIETAAMYTSMPQLLDTPVPVETPVGDGAAWFVPGTDVVYKMPLNYPRHERCVEVTVDIGEDSAAEEVVVLGADLSHEYVCINADYRS